MPTEISLKWKLGWLTWNFRKENCKQKKLWRCSVALEVPMDICLGEMLNNVPATINWQCLSWGLWCGHGVDLAFSSQCAPIPETLQWSFTKTTVRRLTGFFCNVSFFYLQLGVYSWCLFFFFFFGYLNGFPLLNRTSLPVIAMIALVRTFSCPLAFELPFTLQAVLKQV